VDRPSPPDILISMGRSNFQVGHPVPDRQDDPDLGRLPPTTDHDTSMIPLRGLPLRLFLSTVPH
jgi:hypothetical protein